MQREQKFMADLLTVLSSEDSEDQQIAAARTLAQAYAADLRAGSDPVQANKRLMEAHSAIIAEQNQRRLHSRHWRIFEAAELVLGDVKISPRPASFARTAS
jgi:uncharacterized protein with ATP-grasp and redox domains